MAGSGEHYMPRPDGNFAAWANQYYDAVVKWWNANELEVTDLKPLEEALVTWAAAYPAHVAAQQRAEGARQAKDAARRELERQVRPISNFVQTYFNTSNADRAEMGITVRDTSPSPAPAPTTRPLALVQSGQRLTHQLRLVDESTPTRRARPKGVLGAEVWVKLVTPGEPAPTDPAALTFLTMTTKTAFATNYPAEAGGKAAVYMLRWINTRGEKGPWSDVATATVAA